MLNRELTNIIESGSFSFPKTAERKNQDSVLPPKKVDNGYLFAVADGVGSYAGGEQASSIAIEFLESLTSANDICDASFVFNSIKHKITQLSRIDDSLSSAATTLTYGYIDSNELVIGHIGDCRLYIKKDRKLKQITRDHTRYQELVENKVFTKKFLEDKKAKSILTTAISSNVTMEYDTLRLPVKNLVDCSGEVSLYIMSDGTHGAWDKRRRIVETTVSNITSTLYTLIKRVRYHGPSDDYSAVGLTIHLDDSRDLVLL
ncbi:PP2C family protein-serine/threonine phosphatase [Ferrimonas pelagia]|uniref:PPM-type phosphatase domain-containing protein n=1 Tax=Ferrimonas pelagia TaxID=1177826 RepID=A0ABP9EII4_9GAMM